MDAGSDHVETFGWQECAELLADLILEHPMVLSRNRKFFVSTESDAHGDSLIEFHVPECMPVGEEAESPQHYLDELTDELGEQLVLLMQAGAAALGWWSDDEIVHHKVLKTYAVRGRGRAQTLHVKTKGKSRYGSRLRLRNAQKQLVDINEKLHEWWNESGAGRSHLLQLSAAELA